MHDTPLHSGVAETVSLTSGDSYIINKSRATQGFFFKKSKEHEQQPDFELSNVICKTKKPNCIYRIKSWLKNKSG
jgi:hypothetical protein